MPPGGCATAAPSPVLSPGKVAAGRAAGRSGHPRPPPGTPAAGEPLSRNRAAAAPTNRPPAPTVSQPGALDAGCLAREIVPVELKPAVETSLADRYVPLDAAAGATTFLAVRLVGLRRGQVLVTAVTATGVPHEVLVDPVAVEQVAVEVTAGVAGDLHGLDLEQALVDRWAARHGLQPGRAWCALPDLARVATFVRQPPTGRTSCPAPRKPPINR